MNETNWAKNKETVSRYDTMTLENAKRQEREKMKKGHKWVEINKRIKILVPFGTDGKPTEIGMGMIEKHKELAGIK